MARKLNIKNLVPRKDSQYRQGYYRILNSEKYIGDYHKIIYRSSWELKFCKFCDLNEKVLKWSSESIQVPYLNPLEGSMKTYNVDFYMKVLKDNGEIKEYIVEVKPAKKLEKPKAPRIRLNEKKMNSHIAATKEYLINMHKFDAAKKWATDRGWEFIIVSEQFLFGH